jgi:hypothetical protein
MTTATAALATNDATDPSYAFRMGQMHEWFNDVPNSAARIGRTRRRRATAPESEGNANDDEGLEDGMNLAAAERARRLNRVITGISH